MGKRKHSGSDEEDTETGSPRQSAPRNRNLEDMLNGDIPELESNQAQIRFRYKKASMKYFGNMDRGTFGISIVVPAVQQAAMILEHTKDILPGFVVGMLEALQKQMPRDKRIAAWLKEYKRMEAAMKSRGGKSYLCCGPTAQSLHTLVGTSQQLTIMCLCLCSFAESRQGQEAQ